MICGVKRLSWLYYHPDFCSGQGSPRPSLWDRGAQVVISIVMIAAEEFQQVPIVKQESFEVQPILGLRAVSIDWQVAKAEHEHVDLIRYGVLV